MSDQKDDLTSQDHSHDSTHSLTTSVEEKDGEFVVVKNVDGETSVVETFHDKHTAEVEADMLERAAGRYDGAHEEAVPDSYPGKGVDETGNVPPESPGA